MPSSKEWETFHEWGLRFGPIVMVKVMGQRMCIINSYAVADELLNGRSGIYSDRPALTMVNDLMDWVGFHRSPVPNMLSNNGFQKFNMGLQQYGPVYKKHRKVFQSGFSSERSTGYQAVQNREITLLLQKLLEHPTEIDHYLKSAIGAIIMMIGLGYPTTDHDQFIRIAEAAQLAMVSAARPGAYLVDLIPVLKYVPEWFPGAAFKRIAREGRELSHELQTKPFAWAMKQFIDGKALPSFFNDLMEHPEVASEDPVEAEHIIRCTTALMYATGVDTIFSSALTFILAMLHTPEVQKKAQDELDRVVGPDRLPTFTDKKSLPYISAILKESLRWESVIPLGVPHRVMKDDTYQGYSIPAGTIIIANQWGMSTDFFNTLSLCLPGDWIFRNLELLNWQPWLPRAFHHVRLFLAPRIRVLELGSIENISHLSIFSNLAVKCPFLTTVFIRLRPRTVDGNLAVPILSNFLGGLRRVESLELEVPQLDQTALAHLVQLPHHQNREYLV
ncbi:cytochrome P450 [Mycena rebaudengoi]|nr:cytochrome P450 [Mycena rebaudengoi]